MWKLAFNNCFKVKQRKTYNAPSLCSPYQYTLSSMATIGIRREDKDRWERRVPLSPDHVQQLVEQGIDVIVQPSNLRVFDNESYEEVPF